MHFWLCWGFLEALTAYLRRKGSDATNALLTQSQGKESIQNGKSGSPTDVTGG